MRAYLYFLLVGFISFFVGYISTNYVFKVAGVDEFLFWIGIFVLLNLTLAIVLRKRGAKLSPYMFLLSLFVFFLAVGCSILASFFWAAYLERQGVADVIHEVVCFECSRVIEVNESVLKKYPKLKEILERLKEENYVLFKPNELDEVAKLIGYGGCIKYDGTCYALYRITP